MTPLDKIRAKVEEVRRAHKTLNGYCLDCDRRPCDALQGWEAALKLAEELERWDEVYRTTTLSAFDRQGKRGQLALADIAKELE